MSFQCLYFNFSWQFTFGSNIYVFIYYLLLRLWAVWDKVLEMQEIFLQLRVE